MATTATFKVSDVLEFFTTDFISIFAILKVRRKSRKKSQQIVLNRERLNDEECTDTLENPADMWDTSSNEKML